MAYQMRSTDAERRHEVMHDRRQINHATAADIFRRDAMSRQIERVNRALGRQGFMVEQPIVEIATKPMHENDRHAALTAQQIADRAPANLDCFRGRAFIFLVIGGGHVIGLEFGNEGVDICVRGVSITKHAEQGANG